MAARIELVAAGPCERVDGALRPGGLLRGAMGDGIASVSKLVTGELHDLREARREELEPGGPARPLRLGG